MWRQLLDCLLVEQHLKAGILLLAGGTGCIQAGEHVFFLGVLDSKEILLVLELTQVRLLVVETMKSIVLDRWFLGRRSR